MQLLILSVTQTLDNQTVLKNIFLKKNIPEGLKKGFYIPYYNISTSKYISFFGGNSILGIIHFILTTITSSKFVVYCLEIYSLFNCHPFSSP